MKKIALFVCVVIVMFVWTVPVISANGGFRIIYGQTVDYLLNIGKPAIQAVQSFVDEVGNIDEARIEFLDPVDIDANIEAGLSNLVPKLYGSGLLNFLSPNQSMLVWSSVLPYSKVLHISGKSYMTEVIGRYLFDIPNAGNGEFDLYIGTANGYGAVMLYRAHGNASIEDRAASRYLIRYRIDEVGYGRYDTSFYRPQGVYGVYDPGNFWITDDQFFFELKMVNGVRVFSNTDALLSPL